MAKIRYQAMLDAGVYQWLANKTKEKRLGNVSKTINYLVKEFIKFEKHVENTSREKVKVKSFADKIDDLEKKFNIPKEF